MLYYFIRLLYIKDDSLQFFHVFISRIFCYLEKCCKK